MYFYTTKMNFQKGKLRKQSHWKLHQKNKTPGLENGSEVGGSWTHLLEHPTGTPSWSSEEQWTAKGIPAYMKFGSQRFQKTLKNKGDCVGMVRSLGPMQGARLMQSLAWCLVLRMAAATGALEESWISNCNFAAPFPPIAGRPVPHQDRPGCLKLLGEIKRQCSPAGTVVTG